MLTQVTPKAKDEDARRQVDLMDQRAFGCALSCLIHTETQNLIVKAKGGYQLVHSHPAAPKHPEIYPTMREAIIGLREHCLRAAIAIYLAEELAGRGRAQ